MSIKENSTESVSWYLSSFDKLQKSGSEDTAFASTRQQAMRKFAELGFPSTKDEEWKYTSVASLLDTKLEQKQKSESIKKAAIAGLAFSTAKDNTLIFINGIFSDELSTVTLAGDGVVVSTLSQALIEHRDLVQEHLGKYINYEEESFTALNTGFMQNGLFVHVPENANIKEAIQVIYLTTPEAGSFVAHPRSLVVLGKNSSCDIIESFHSESTSLYFNNAVAEFLIAENAQLDHVKIQQEGAEAYHISNYQFHQERDSRVSTLNVDLGSALVRNNTNVILNDINCETHLFGFFMGGDTQHIDNHTFIDHAKPHCFSNELYKGILDDKSKGVFNGKILVRQDAQKTNALQSNKTLLLTDDAVINAKPQLEIFADDVKCTHGATIGQLDDEALFYLRARGINEEMAGAMLRHAFVSDVLENAKDEEVRTYLDAKVIQRFTQ